MNSKQEQLKTLQKLIDLMSSEKTLLRDLQLTFQEIQRYITRNS